MKVPLKQRLMELALFALGSLLGFAIGNQFGYAREGFLAGNMLAFSYVVFERLRR